MGCKGMGCKGVGCKGVVLGGIFAAAIVTACGRGNAAPLGTPAPAIRCGGGVVAQGSVSRVEDGRNFVLADGREVVLAGIEVPHLPPPHQAAAPPEGSAAKIALTALVAGATAVLRRAEYGPDRYGRVVAYVDTVRGTSASLVQAALVAAGLARVGDFVGSQACATELLDRERAARNAKLGLWASPYYAILKADDPASILAQRGSFALVEGKVVSAHQSGATVYLNFGRRWSDDFTVTIRKRNKRSFTAAGLNPDGLSGRPIRVRGWIERRRGLFGARWGGPTIEAEHPEQIETSGLE
jgi:endonuclease YncB( thermonuclease family)